MCPIGFLMLGSTLQDLPSDSPAACRSACRRRRASPSTGSHQRTILACTRPILVSHAVELAMPNHLPRRRPGPHRRLGWPSTACASFEHEAPTQADDSRSWTQRATTPTPAIPAIRRPTHRRAPGPHFGRTQRTRQRTNTGRRHRTPDSAHLDAQTPAPDTGQRSRGQASVDTGRWHRTPDTGRGRGQADEGAAGIRTSWATTPSDRTLGRPTVFLWTAPAALDSPCRLGDDAAFQREIASRRQLVGRSAGVERRLGALLSLDDCGSSVERTAKLHPLWQAPMRVGA
jgi:hypothetical protein